MAKVMIQPATYENVREAMEGAVSVVNAETCIACFCCQEICPEKAITLRQRGE